MNSERKQKQDMLDLAGEFGCQLDWEHTRKGHVRAIFRADTKSHAIVMAKGHGGDVRGRQNNLCRARRDLRALTGRTA